MAVSLLPVSTAFASPEDGICVGPESAIDVGAEQAIRALTNEFRAANGVAPLSGSPRLTRAARRHSVRMAREDFFGHSSQGGGFPWSRNRAAGENLALAETPEAAMELLKGSSTHRHTLLSRTYHRVGIGVFRTCTGSLLVTQDFTS